MDRFFHCPKTRVSCNARANITGVKGMLGGISGSVQHILYLCIVDTLTQNRQHKNKITTYSYK